MGLTRISPKPRNVTLFGKRIFADAITLKLILDWGEPYIQ